MNVTHIIDEIYVRLLALSEEGRNEFINTKKKDLIKYHHGLGRQIRNEFGLWELSWEPKIENGVDASPDHPDAISMRIIESVWERAQSNLKESVDNR